MKFLLEFVSCCGSSSRRMVEEETRSLVVEARRPRRRKRGRLVAVRVVGGGGSSGSHVAEWKPTLSSISEDNVLPERNKNVVGSESVKRKKPSSSAPKARAHHYLDDVGRAPITAIMPALSPTPFLF